MLAELKAGLPGGRRSEGEHGAADARRLASPAGGLAGPAQPPERAGAGAGRRDGAGAAAHARVAAGPAGGAHRRALREPLPRRAAAAGGRQRAGAVAQRRRPRRSPAPSCASWSSWWRSSTARAGSARDSVHTPGPLGDRPPKSWCSACAWSRSARWRSRCGSRCATPRPAPRRRCASSSTAAPTLVDRRVLDELRAPLLHLVRNAVDHGLEAQPASGRRSGKPLPGAADGAGGVARRGQIDVSVEDDGRGIDVTQVGQRAVQLGLRTEEEAGALTGSRLLRACSPCRASAPATRSTEVSGPRHGHGRGGAGGARRWVARCASTPPPASGTTFTLSIPVSVLSTRVLFVRLGHETLALPLSGVEVTERLPPNAFYEVGGRPLRQRGRPAAAGARARPGPASPDAAGRTAVVRVRTRRGPAGAAGGRGARRGRGGGAAARAAGAANQRRGGQHRGRVGRGGGGARPAHARPVGLSAARAEAPASRTGGSRVLVVDDSITTRTLERHILERAGYLVELARDGVEALAALRAQRLRPGGDRLRDAQPRRHRAGAGDARRRGARSTIPAILVTSVTDEETRRRALAAGAQRLHRQGRASIRTRCCKTIGELLARGAPRMAKAPIRWCCSGERRRDGRRWWRRWSAAARSRCWAAPATRRWRRACAATGGPQCALLFVEARGADRPARRGAGAGAACRWWRWRSTARLGVQATAAGAVEALEVDASAERVVTSAPADDGRHRRRPPRSTGGASRPPRRPSHRRRPGAQARRWCCWAPRPAARRRWCSCWARCRRDFAVPLVLVQHMPDDYHPRFVAWLAGQTPLTVRWPRRAARWSGRGGAGGARRARTWSSAPAATCSPGRARPTGPCPSVDVLFESAAQLRRLQRSAGWC